MDRRSSLGMPHIPELPRFNTSETLPVLLAGSSNDDIPPPKADFSAPPPYELATKLPTYEEVQREKDLEGQAVPVIRCIPPQAVSLLP